MFRSRRMTSLPKFANVRANVQNHFILEGHRVDRQMFKPRLSAALVE